MQFYEQTLSSYNNLTADPKKKNYFEGAATLVLLIILILMIYPALQHIADVNKEIETNKVIDKKLADKIASLDQAEQNLAKITSDLPLLEQALPTGSNIKTYLKTPLETIASKHNVVLKSAQFTDIPISDPPVGQTLSVRNIDFAMSLTGKFTDLVGFLNEAENFIRITSVRSVSLKGDSSQQTMSLEATTNFLGAPLSIVPNQTGGTLQ